MARIILYLSAILVFCWTCQGINVSRSSAARYGELNSYYVYTRDNPREPLRVYATSASATATRIMRTKTVVLVHDHGGSFRSSLNPTVKDALLTSEDVSVIVVDYAMIAALNYEFAVGAVPEVASGIADMIRFMVNARRITLNNLHLVGFGLGAHIVAYTARALASSGTVARITGLDPAGELWTSNSGRLKADDAHYVEVIHTDSGGNGISESIGLVDFYPNGGINQLGCSIIDNQCHHDRSWLMFAATLTHGPLEGHQCTEGAAPSEDNCRGYALAMGNNELDKYGADRFYVVTSNKYPYHPETTVTATATTSTASSQETSATPESPEIY